MKNKKLNLADHVDKDRRAFLEKLVATSAFAVPLTLGADLLLTRSAYAQDNPAASSDDSSEGVEGGEGAESSGPDTPGGLSSEDSGGDTSGGDTSGGDTTGGVSSENSSEGEILESSSSGGSVWIDPNPTPDGTVSVPTPGTLALFGLGLAGIELARRAKKGNSDEEI